MASAFQAIGYSPDKIRYVLNRADSAGGMDLRGLSEQIGRQPDYQVVSDGRLVVEVAAAVSDRVPARERVAVAGRR